MIVQFLEPPGLWAIQAQHLALVSLSWRQTFGSQHLWKCYYFARWDHCHEKEKMGIEWQELYISRHRGAISPMTCTRPKKRPNVWGSKGGNKRYKGNKKNERIPNSPKPAITPYFAYLRDMRQSTKEPNPDLNGKQLTCKELGENWRNMHKELKLLYDIVAQEDSCRFQTEKGRWLVARRRVARIKPPQFALLIELVRKAPGGWRHSSVKGWLNNGAWKASKKSQAHCEATIARLENTGNPGREAQPPFPPPPPPGMPGPWAAAAPPKGAPSYPPGGPS
jgi:hypothetical protein